MLDLRFFFFLNGTLIWLHFIWTWFELKCLIWLFVCNYVMWKSFKISVVACVWVRFKRLVKIWDKVQGKPYLCFLMTHVSVFLEVVTGIWTEFTLLIFFFFLYCGVTLNLWVEVNSKNSSLHALFRTLALHLYLSCLCPVWPPPESFSGTVNSWFSELL